MLKALNVLKQKDSQFISKTSAQLSVLTKICLYNNVLSTECRYQKRERQTVAIVEFCTEYIC